MADRKAYNDLASRQSMLAPNPASSPENATARFLAERYAVGDAPTPSGYYGHYATDPHNTVIHRGILTPGARYADGKIHPAWPSFIHDAWEGMKTFADADPRDNSQESIDRLSKAAFDAAGLAVTGGLASPRPTNSIGMFGGRRAKTADQAALAEAQQMAADGAPRKDIWSKTGWFKGVDGKWRYEIDDSGAFVPHPTQNEVTHNGIATGSNFRAALNHPALFDAYPDMSRTSWTIGNNNYNKGHMSHRADGFAKREIFASAPTTLERQSVLLHEGQHGLQGIEGFSGGASPFDKSLDGYAQKLAEEVNKGYSERLNALAKSGDWDAYSALDGERRAKVDAIFDEDRNGGIMGGMLGYRRAAGEVEARAVQKRMNMTPEERRARPPWLDYDVPEADQIVRFSNSTKPLTSIADFLKDRYGSNSPDRDLLYSNPKESAGLPLGVKAIEGSGQPKPLKPNLAETAKTSQTAGMKPYVAPEQYRGQHSAPDHESGSPLHDVTSNGIYPNDFYSPNGRRYYGSGDDTMDAAAFEKIYRMRNKPDEVVAVWRAIPEVPGKKKGLILNSSHINPGDWVAINRQYAIDHGESALNGKYHIAKRMVPARELFTSGDSIHEWGWSPQKK